jgi:hypothetical protein
MSGFHAITSDLDSGRYSLLFNGVGHAISGRVRLFALGILIPGLAAIRSRSNARLPFYRLPVQNPFTNFRARAHFRKSLRVRGLASSNPIRWAPPNETDNELLRAPFNRPALARQKRESAARAPSRPRRSSVPGQHLLDDSIYGKIVGRCFTSGNGAVQKACALPS